MFSSSVRVSRQLSHSSCESDQELRFKVKTLNFILLTDKHSDGIRALNCLPQLLPLELFNGVIAWILLDHQPLQNALLSLEVSSVDHGLLAEGSEEDNGRQGEDTDSLGELLVLQLDDGNSSRLGVVINILQLLQDSLALLTVRVGVLNIIF